MYSCYALKSNCLENCILFLSFMFLTHNLVSHPISCHFMMQPIKHRHCAFILPAALLLGWYFLTDGVSETYMKTECTYLYNKSLIKMCYSPVLKLYSGPLQLLLYISLPTLLMNVCVSCWLVFVIPHASLPNSTTDLTPELKHCSLVIALLSHELQMCFVRKKATLAVPNLAVRSVNQHSRLNKRLLFSDGLFTGFDQSLGSGVDLHKLCLFPLELESYPCRCCCQVGVLALHLILAAEDPMKLKGQFQEF